MKDDKQNSKMELRVKVRLLSGMDIEKNLESVLKHIEFIEKEHRGCCTLLEIDFDVDI